MNQLRTSGSAVDSVSSVEGVTAGGDRSEPGAEPGIRRSPTVPHGWSVGLAGQPAAGRNSSVAPWRQPPATHSGMAWTSPQRCMDRLPLRRSSQAPPPPGSCPPSGGGVRSRGADAGGDAGPLTGRGSPQTVRGHPPGSTGLAGDPVRPGGRG